MRVWTFLFILSICYSNLQAMQRTEASKIPPLPEMEENFDFDVAVYGQGYLGGGGGGVSVRTQGEKWGLEGDYSYLYESMQKLGISYLYYPDRKSSGFYFGGGPGWLLGEDEPMLINGFCGFQFAPDPSSRSHFSGFIDGGMIFGVVDFFGTPLPTPLTPTARLGIGTHF